MIFPNVGLILSLLEVRTSLNYNLPLGNKQKRDCDFPFGTFQKNDMAIFPLPNLKNTENTILPLANLKKYEIAVFPLSKF